MDAQRERAERPSAAKAGLIRGVLVILTAVAIGAFVVASGLGDDSETESIAAATDVASGSAAGDGGDDAAESSDDDVDPSGAEATTGSDDDVDAMADDATDDGDAMADGADAEGATDGDTTGTTAGDPSTGPAGPGIEAPAEVTVLVLNGAGAKGIAGRGSAILDEAGYDVLAPKNADFLGPSLVLYTEGFEEEAAAVAEVFEADAAVVVQPLDPSDPPINDTRDADIVVVVGEDGLINV